MRTRSIGIFDIPTLGLQGGGRQPGRCEDIGQGLGHAGRHLPTAADHHPRAVADQSGNLGSLAAQRILHIARSCAARDGRDQPGQTPLGLPDGEFLAVEEVAVGMALPKNR